MPGKAKTLKPTTENPSNKFNPLGAHTEREEKKEFKESQTETHAGFDAIWKLLKSKRRECRALQYIFWAAVLIEKDGQPIDEGGLTQLVEAILVDPTLGDHHLKKLPLQYHEKMVLCVNKIFALPEVNNNNSNYLTFLSDWYQQLNDRIKTELGNNYQIDDQNRDRIKEIIQADPLAQRIRQELHLEEITESLQEDKSSAPNPDKKPVEKTGQDHYIDYLLAETDEEAQYSLSEAARLHYVDDASNSKAAQGIICDEHYLAIAKELYKDRKKDSILLKILSNAANKGSGSAQYILKEIYDNTLPGVAPMDPRNADKYFNEALKAGFAIAQHNRAIDLLDAGKIGEAIELLKKAAAQNYVDSQNHLGFLYNGGEVNGRAVVAKDIPQAIHWFKKGISQDDARSKFNLGIIYLDKEGGFYDQAEGLRLITEAAEQGYDRAQNHLGSFYTAKATAAWDGLNGNYNDIITNLDKARALFAKAEAQELMKKARSKEFNPLYSTNLANINKFRQEVEQTHQVTKQFTRYRFTRNDSNQQQIYLQKLLQNKHIKLERVREGGWEGFQVLLPPGDLNKDLRPYLGLSRVGIAKLSERDEERLKALIPHATFEMEIKKKPDDKDRLLITFPLDLEKKYKEIIGSFKAEDKSQPSQSIQPNVKEALVTTKNTAEK